ncbi:MAG TPA: choice-of-anchor D domain-containing protein [Terriglobia bacterium]|nr:choice-of-anchor D domain-containing protein [Terriglobia bacterium]
MTPNLHLKSAAKAALERIVAGLPGAGCILLLWAAIATSCGGGSSSTPPPPGKGAPSANLSATVVTFVTQKVGTTSAASDVILTNSGTAALNVSAISLSGANLAEFAETNDCAGSVAASSSCTIGVTFRPSAEGKRTATLSIKDNAPGSPQSVALAGTGGTGINPDPLGTVISSQTTACSGGLAGDCTQLTIACPDVANITPTLKVIHPSGASAGTIMFIVGGGGVGFYDKSFAFGSDTVNKVLAAGFTAVEIDFAGPSAGWLTGPGGPRKLACRFATAALWVHDHVRTGGTPFCATGNSAGSGAIAYGLAHFGLGGIFDMVEPTSGPPMGRLDIGCVCAGAKMAGPCGTTLLTTCIGLSDAQAYIDPAYGSPICSNAVTTHDTTNEALFLNDSVASPDATYAYPTTDVHALYGGMDLTASVPLGLDWVNLISTQKEIECVMSAAHSMPDNQTAADKIGSDLASSCKAQ